jgi:hypothetical protein
MSGSGRYDLSEVGPYDYYDGSRFYRKAGFVVVRRLGATKRYEVTTKFSVRSSYKQLDETVCRGLPNLSAVTRKSCGTSRPSRPEDQIQVAVFCACAGCRTYFRFTRQTEAIASRSKPRC